MRFSSYDEFDECMMNWISDSGEHAEFEFTCRDMKCRLSWESYGHNIRVEELETIDTNLGLYTPRLITVTPVSVIEESFDIEKIIHTHWKEKKKNDPLR